MTSENILHLGCSQHSWDTSNPSEIPGFRSPLGSFCRAHSCSFSPSSSGFRGRAGTGNSVCADSSDTGSCLAFGKRFKALSSLPSSHSTPCSILLLLVGLGLGNSTAPIPPSKKQGDEHRRPRVSNLFMLSSRWLLFILLLCWRQFGDAWEGGTERTELGDELGCRINTTSPAPLVSLGGNFFIWSQPAETQSSEMQHALTQGRLWI